MVLTRLFYFAELLLFYRLRNESQLEKKILESVPLLFVRNFSGGMVLAFLEFIAVFCLPVCAFFSPATFQGHAEGDR